LPADWLFVMCHATYVCFNPLLIVLSFYSVYSELLNKP
jgi:hypothetical protein